MSYSTGFVLNNPQDFFTRFLPGAFFVGSITGLSLSIPEIQMDVLGFIHSSPLLSIFFYSLLSLLVGMIFENLGSTFEARCLDTRGKPKKEGGNKTKHGKVWRQYLQQEIEGSPVGHRYLRTLVLRLKFMLGMLLASASLCFMLVFPLFCSCGHSRWLLICFGLNFLLLLLSLWSVYALSDLLHETRVTVLKGLKKAEQRYKSD